MGELGLVYDVVIRLVPRQGPLIGYRIVLWGHFKYLVLDIGAMRLLCKHPLLSGGIQGYSYAAACPEASGCCPAIFKLESGLFATYKGFTAARGWPLRLHPSIDIVLEDPFLLLHLPLYHCIHKAHFSAEGPS